MEGQVPGYAGLWRGDVHGTRWVSGVLLCVCVLWCAGPAVAQEHADGTVEANRLIELAQKLARDEQPAKVRDADQAIAPVASVEAAPTNAIEVKPAAPVVPVSPNDLLPLGRGGALQTGGSASNSETTGLAQSRGGVVPWLAASGSRSTGSSSGWALKTLSALGLVIAMILFTRLAMQRLGGRVAAAGRSQAVQVLSRTTVAPRNHVLLLRVGGRILVVNDSSQGMRTLCEVSDPDEVASLIGSVNASKPRSISEGFTQMLHNFNNNLDEADVIQDGGADETEHSVDRAREQVSALIGRLRAISFGRRAT
ncbi:MAG: hypothetical protein GC164_05395 [Phycisphaera sp.]|nr:hypothetical protein [Phycisphaera sp.]